MTDVVLYFQIHQPWRLERFTFFDIGRGRGYFDDTENARILRRVAERCYLPMNELLAEQIERHEGKFRFAMALTGTVIEQLERWHPEALESFRRLARTGQVEIVCETSHHSLCFLEDPEEFAEQVAAQRERIREVFDQDPVTFRCTELVISNDIARQVEEMGFAGLLGEGADHLLGFRSTHRVYWLDDARRLSLLLRDYERSDDVAFRFSNRGWDKWPLTADVFADWLAETAESDEEAEYVGLFMDYETFGEHQWRETGIFDFMEHVPGFVLDRGLAFAKPSEAVERYEPAGELDAPHPVSWADTERDLTAWLGNHMQRAANRALYDLGPDVKRAAAAGHPDVLRDWRRLTTSDHVYYMCTKYFSDGDVHKYFSPYTTPHDAFIAFMNVLADLESRIRAILEDGRDEVAPASRRGPRSEDPRPKERERTRSRR